MNSNTNGKKISSSTKQLLDKVREYQHRKMYSEIISILEPLVEELKRSSEYANDLKRAMLYLGDAYGHLLQFERAMSILEQAEKIQENSVQDDIYQKSHKHLLERISKMVDFGRISRWERTDGSQRRTMGSGRTFTSESGTPSGWQGTSESGRPCDPEWHFVGLAHGSTLA